MTASTTTTPSAEATTRPPLWVRFWRMWLRLLAMTEPGTTLALFRIAVACVVFGSLTATVFADVVDVVWVEKAHGGLNKIRRVPFWIEVFGGATPTVVHGMLATCMTSLALVGVGFQSRLFALIAGQSYMSLYRLNPWAHGAYDMVITNALFILVLADASRTLSVDCKRRTGRWTSDDEVSVWPRGLVMLNLALMYGTTGIQKVSVYWTPAGGYSALFYVLQQPSWHNFSMDWIAPYYFFTQVGTFVTWWWEVSTPVLLGAAFFVRLFPTPLGDGRPGRVRRATTWLLQRHVDLRVVFAVTGVAMHGIIILCMSVGPFSYISMSLYICLFSADEWRRCGQWLRRRIAPAAAS